MQSPQTKTKAKPRLDTHCSFLCEKSMQIETSEKQLTPVSHPTFAHLKMWELGTKTAVSVKCSNVYKYKYHEIKAV